jgi:hypothetical protein
VSADDKNYPLGAQHPDGLGPVCGLTPNSLARDAHCAATQPRHTELISDQKLAGFHRQFLTLRLYGCVFLHALFPFDYSVVRMGYRRSDTILNLRMSALPSNGSGRSETS